MTLTTELRSKLDGIVAKMASMKAPAEHVQAVVSDYLSHVGDMGMDVANRLADVGNTAGAIVNSGIEKMKKGAGNIAGAFGSETYVAPTNTSPARTVQGGGREFVNRIEQAGAGIGQIGGGAGTIAATPYIAPLAIAKPEISKAIEGYKALSDYLGTTPYAEAAIKKLKEIVPADIREGAINAVETTGLETIPETYKAIKNLLPANTSGQALMPTAIGGKDPLDLPLRLRSLKTGDKVVVGRNGVAEITGSGPDGLHVRFLSDNSNDVVSNFDSVAKATKSDIAKAGAQANADAMKIKIQDTNAK